jgi:hypothetical protein
MSKKKRKTLEELFLRERVSKQLYSGGPLFCQGSVFSEMLQAMIDASLHS